MTHMIHDGIMLEKSASYTCNDRVFVDNGYSITIFKTNYISQLVSHQSLV